MKKCDNAKIPMGGDGVNNEWVKNKNPTIRGRILSIEDIRAIKKCPDPYCDTPVYPFEVVVCKKCRVGAGPGAKPAKLVEKYSCQIIFVMDDEEQTKASFIGYGKTLDKYEDGGVVKNINEKQEDYLERKLTHLVDKTGELSYFTKERDGVTQHIFAGMKEEDNDEEGE